MVYKKKTYDKRLAKYKNIQMIVFILSIGTLGLIAIISLNAAIIQGKVKLNYQVIDDYTLAKEYYKNKDYNKAKSILKKEIRNTIDPKKQYEANILLGKIYNETEEYDAAIKIFNTMTNSLFLDEKLKHNLGISYLEKEMYDEALISPK